MIALSSSLAGRIAGMWIACSVPFAAFGAPAADAAASQPHGPTIGSDIATQCKHMSGDERTACERDIRNAARKRHHPAAKSQPPAASAAG